jgi:ribosome-associated translation inhibitor RaiA
MQRANEVDSTLPSGQKGLVPFPYDIKFVDSENSPAMRSVIEEYLERISHYYDRITFGRVYVRIPHKHGGVRFFHIHIQLDVPGRRLAVSREPEIDDTHTDVRTAIRDAFHAMKRELLDFIKHRSEHKGATVLEGKSI